MKNAFPFLKGHSFHEGELAKALAMDAYVLREFQPDGIGVPGHWFPNKAQDMFYTERGVECLAYGLENAGHEAQAVTLRALLKQRQETPSRDVVPAPSNDQAPWFRSGEMA